MMRRRLTGVLVGVALVAGATEARAQGPAPLDTAFLHVNFGVQAASRDLNQDGAFELYDELATFRADTKIKGGPLFDIGGGYRVWENVYATISYTHLSDDSNANLTGNIPHPLVTDRLRPVSGSVNNLDHSENQWHLDALWRAPITTKFDVGVFIGPTIFSVNQDLVSGIEVAEVGPPFTSVNVTNINVTDASDTSVGFNLGADGTYMITPRFGAGVLLRFSHGSVELPNGPAATVKLDVGGFQFAFGGRVRF
jgi:hypothetical protein